MNKNLIRPSEASLVRLVISDLDGTLLTDEKELSERSLRAIEALRRTGVLFTVCTGREYAMLDYFNRQILPTAPIVGNNGGEVIRFPSGEVIHRTLLPKQESMRFLSFCEENGVDFCVTTPVNAFFPHGTHMAQFYLDYEQQAAREGLNPFPVLTLDRVAELRDLPLNKIILRNDFPETKRAKEYLRQETDAFDTTLSSELILEVMPRGMSKASGAQRLIRYLGLTPEECCAVGDYDNDIELFRLVGLPVAMGNAKEAVKQEARYITKCNQEDGVACLLEEIAAAHATDRKSD